MSTVRTVFLGTTEFALFALKALCADPHYNVVGVVSQPDRPAGRKLQLQASPVKTFAIEKNIPVLTPEDINHSEVIEQIKSWRAESAVVVAFGQILRSDFLNLFPEHIVNVHVSVLPRWRGAAPVQRALLADDKEIGVTLQKVVKKLDAGDILGVRKMALTDEHDASKVFAEMIPHMQDLLHVDLMDYLRGNLAGAPQDEAMVTYAKKIEKAEAEIHWHKSAREIFNQVRAFILGPGSWSVFKGKKIKILQTRVKKTTGKNPPGKILAVGKEELIVGCGVGELELLLVQPESRKSMPIGDFIKGYVPQKGDSFG